MRETHFNSTRQEFPAIESIIDPNDPAYQTQTSIAFQTQKSILGEPSNQLVDNKQSFFSTTNNTFDISAGPSQTKADKLKDISKTSKTKNSDLLAGAST